MSDRYAVFGNPVAHSKSPLIHAAFAAQTGEAMSYEAISVPIDGFAQAVRDFAAAGGKGANVTLPFKEEACRLADALSERARLAGAVNTLTFANGRVAGDNTDGAGLIRDLKEHLHLALIGRRILLLGAGGAARGVIAPLLAEQPALLFIANRTADKARTLAGEFNAAEMPESVSRAALQGSGFADLPAAGFDLVINATSASLSGELPPLPAHVFAPGGAAYDMMYGKGETPFLALARQRGVALQADGLGMLVEQAAEAFFIWRGIRPDTAPVRAALAKQREG